MKNLLTLSLLAISSLGLVSNSVKAADTDNSVSDKASVNVSNNASSSGKLQFLKASSKLDMGTVELKADESTVKTTQQSVLETNILDSRTTGAGWQVQVSYANGDDSSKAWQSSDGNHLTGSKLTINPTGSTFSYDGNSPAEGDPNEPTLGSSFDVSGTPATVYYAQKGQGKGNWDNTMTKDKSNVTLTIPTATTLKGTYTSTLDWNLVDAPI